MPDSSRLKIEAITLYDTCYEISYYNNYITHALYPSFVTFLEPFFKIIFFSLLNSIPESSY